MQEEEDDFDDEEEYEDAEEEEWLRWARAIEPTLTRWQRVVLALPRWLTLGTAALIVGGLLAPLGVYVLGMGPPPPWQVCWYAIGAALLTWLAWNRRDAMLDGMGRPRPRSPGTAPSDALIRKATAAVLSVLSAGPLTRADLVRSLALRLRGDADANLIVGRVVLDDFHRGKPWLYDGWRAALPEHEDRLRQLRNAEAIPWHFGLAKELGDGLTAVVLFGVILFAVLGAIGLLVFGLKQLL
jgi:hypothetical protein